MIDRLRRGALACCLAAALAVAAAPVHAVETGPGTKNFTVPPGVPDHFSNEAEPFASTPAAEGPVPHSTVSRGPRARAVAHRGRDRHGRGGRHVASRTVHGRHTTVRAASAHTASHAASRRASTHVAAARRTASRPHTAAAKPRG